MSREETRLRLVEGISRLNNVAVLRHIGVGGFGTIIPRQYHITTSAQATRASSMFTYHAHGYTHYQQHINRLMAMTFIVILY